MFNFTKGLIAVILLIVIHFYFYSSQYVKKIDHKVYDLMMTLSYEMREDNDFYTVIVNIDERSLEVLGQWPWSRVVTSNLVDEINHLNPSALGINILFPEVDRNSPINIQKFYKDFLGILDH